MRKRKSDEGITDEVLCAEYEAVYHYILSLCRNNSDAQDITQETFLKAIKSADKFKGNSSLYTYLCAIAKNIWLNKCRKQNREISLHEQQETASETQIEQLISEKDTSLLIHKILHNLDEPYKEVFSLRVFGQLPFADIASLFSKTESWARVTYHRARKLIIERLKGDDLL